MTITLAQQGASVCLACRDTEWGAAIVEYVLSQYTRSSPANISTRILEVGDLESVRCFCRVWMRQEERSDIDVLMRQMLALPAHPVEGALRRRKEQRRYARQTFWAAS